ncbi:methyl-CpG-binding domain-containing protein 5-like [Salvia splendens]|uniref:methyl-CpG-binding domain-containing protein 5-like n=1 Tax=Salvia splendens TaxID=180675 RepID=UPI00110526DE|nr:methyl-CpG-binding domain-containing protein 5-like [Salvia splendens]
MSESHLPPNPLPQPNPTNPENTPADPLLDTDAYIDDPCRNITDAAEAELPKQPLPEFAPGVVIAAEPISMYVPDPEEAAPEQPAPRTARRRDPEEMAKRPSWLPEDWKIELKKRVSGASAGLYDPYYCEPTGQHRFRSKVEVLHFLETGSKPTKRKATSESETAKPSKSPATQTKKKSATNRKKTEAAVDNSEQAAPAVNGAQEDTAQQA